MQSLTSLSHLLFGTNSHSGWSLMSSFWSGNQFRLAAEGGLSFSDAELKRIQSSMNARTLAATEFTRPRQSLAIANASKEELQCQLDCPGVVGGRYGAEVVASCRVLMPPFRVSPTHCGWFQMLKNSARNWRRAPRSSLKRKSLKREIFQLSRPGPRTPLRCVRYPTSLGLAWKRRTCQTTCGWYGGSPLCHSR